MRIDLSDDIFSAGLESPADYNGVHLEHGVILSRRFDQGRIGGWLAWRRNRKRLAELPTTDFTQG